MIQPFGNRIVVKVSPQNISEGGVVLPDNVKTAGPDFATVVGISPTAKTEGRLEVGSKIIFTRSLASKKEDNGETLYIMDVDDVLAIED